MARLRKSLSPSHPPPAPPHDPRWTPAAGSAKVNTNFKKSLQKPNEAYNYTLTSQLPDSDDELIVEEEEDEEAEKDYGDYEDE